VEIGLPAALHSPRLEFAQIVARLVTEKADQERTIAGQSASIDVRLIVELLDGLEDPVARIDVNPGLVIDNARDSFGGHRGEVGNLLDGHGPRQRWRHRR